MATERSKPEPFRFDAEVELGEKRHVRYEVGEKVNPVGSVIGLGVALVLLVVMLLFAVDRAIGGIVGAGVARLTS